MKKIVSISICILMLMNCLTGCAFGSTENLAEKVNTFEEAQSISRELMLLKVKYNKGNRKDIMENCEIMNAQIVDISKTHMIIQVCDVPERTQLFIKMLQGISIVEVARTGTVALKKCCETK